MMGKKDYIAIANVISGLEEIDGNLVSKVNLIIVLADYFEKDNPNFDRDKFNNACQTTQHSWVSNA